MPSSINLDATIELDKGTAEIVVDGVEKAELAKGRGFGEMALLYNQVSSKSVIAKPKSAFWAIDRQKFRDIISKDILTEFDIKLPFIQKADIFCKKTAAFFISLTLPSGSYEGADP